MSYQIATKAAPAQHIISLARDSYISDLQANLDGGIKTLTVYAQSRGVQVDGLPFAIYHGAIREDQHAVVEICLPIASANRRQLLEAGVKPDRIYVANLCTMCRPAEFHSFRRDREAAGRLHSFVGIH